MKNETSLKEYGTVHNAIITLGDTDDSGKGRHFKSRFIQSGVAGYPGQFGNVLITKESLDKFINTMVGVPVIINHKDLNADNVNDERVGVVNSVWYDKKDGWYWCDGIIWDETAQNLITDKNWSVSCSYDVKTADDNGGFENNIKYDMEFLDGVFTHLALVDNPRYERANIVFNSKTFNISNNNFNPYVKGHEEMNIENDKWITIHPNGEDGKGRHLLIKDGENVYDAMRRQWGVETAGQQHLFDKKLYETNDDYKKELYAKLDEQIKKVREKETIEKENIRKKDAETMSSDQFIEKHGKSIGGFWETLDYWEKHNKNYHTKSNNNKETEMALLDELKKLITKAENSKGDENMTIENEKVDKRKLIDEVGGILKGKVDDEVIRTIIGKMEKMSYDKSEAGTADNEKEVDKKDADNCKVKNEDKEPEKDKKEVEEVKEDVKKDVDNKCDKKADNSVDNTKPDYFGRLNEIYNAATSHLEEKSEYVSRADREKAAEDYFKR